jgi:hypothetical protein
VVLVEVTVEPLPLVPLMISAMPAATTIPPTASNGVTSLYA